jgi:tRNA threonylcarbamoyl adenosine modification protein (Sua5/YciO/YrdC/YwlC family)
MLRVIEEAAQALRRGDIVGLPTDTVYGIAADPFQEHAVARLFEIKQRPGIKPIPILAASIHDLGTIVDIDEQVREIDRRFWPGELTIVVRRAADLPPWIGDADRGTVGVRIPDHGGARAVLAAFGPLAVTSANRSGEPPADDDEGAREALGDAVSVYVAGSGGGGPSSTVVDISGPAVRVLRQGVVEWTQ